MRAYDKFCEALNDLRNYTYENAEVDVVFDGDKYPASVIFVPDGQTNLFYKNSSEDGEVGTLRVKISAEGATIENTMDFSIDASVLKKMIRMALEVCKIYYHAYRETNGILPSLEP